MNEGSISAMARSAVLRTGAVLVESLRSAVCRGDQEEAISGSAGLAAVALASGRGLREDQW